jgi:hypothetical protein
LDPTLTRARCTLATSRRFGITIPARGNVEPYHREPVGLPVVSYVGAPVWRLSGTPAIMKPVSDPRQSDMELLGGTARRPLSWCGVRTTRACTYSQPRSASTGGVPRPGRRVHLSAGSRRAPAGAVPPSAGFRPLVPSYPPISGKKLGFSRYPSTSDVSAWHGSGHMTRLTANPPVPWG